MSGRVSALLLAVVAVCVLLIALLLTDADDRSVCKVDPPDGQEAITRAIAACPNGSIVEFPSKRSYRQTGRIDVDHRSNLVIDGNGSTFTTTAPNAVNPIITDSHPNWRVRSARDVTFRDMTVIGNFKRNGPRRMIEGNQFNAGFMVVGGDDVTIADVTVRDTYGDLVWTLTSAPFQSQDPRNSEVPRNVRVQRLKGRRAARQCVAPTGAYGFWLEDSTLEDCWFAGVDAEIDVPGEPLRDVHILRNTVSETLLAGITVPVAHSSRDVKGVEIKQNKILTASDTCLPGIDVHYRPKPGVTMADVVTEDNEVRALYPGIVYRSVASGSIRDNRIRRASPSARCRPQPSPPILVLNSPAVTLSGNTPGG